MTAIIRKPALSIAGLLVAGGMAAGGVDLGPGDAALTAPAGVPLALAAAESDPSDDTAAGQLLDIGYQAQPNYYYCGPAATRIALTALGYELSQDEVAEKLGTTEAGTDSAEDTTRVLREISGDAEYRTTVIEGSKADQAQIDQLRADVRAAVDDGRAVVTNVIGTANDVDGRTHSYPGGHYVTVVGYGEGGEAVKIADPAFLGAEHYWVTTETLAHWIASRGYSH
ncbi:C39 family peptidase [Micromonospora sp. LOL_023]|uniref:C39 family peptidase n=1 Tax=Micromonospora sp. LOL_023 TaxID=3345418 RepID=UPI003A8AE611